MIDPYEVGREFTILFRHFEYALNRTNFLKNKPVAESDWNKFARQLGPEFFRHIQRSKLAETLIGFPPRELMRQDLRWEPERPDPLTNVVELFEQGVCRVRNSLFHGEKLAGHPEQWERDAMLVSDALAVLHEARDRVPAVGGLLAQRERGRALAFEQATYCGHINDHRPGYLPHRIRPHPRARRRGRSGACGYHSSLRPRAVARRAVSEGEGRYTLAIKGGSCRSRNRSMRGSVATKAWARSGNGAWPTMTNKEARWSITAWRSFGKPREAGLIALLFALLVAAMLLAWRDQWKWSYIFFTVTMLLSIYWFDYHATSKLTIQL